MFVIVTIDQKNHRKLPFRSNKMRSETKMVNGTQVAYIHLDSDRKIKWKQIGLMTGGLGKKLVLSNRLELPEGSSLKSYKAKRFSELVLINTAVEILKKSKISFYNMSLGIFDRCATRTSLAEIAVKHLPSVKIVTDYPERLKIFSKEMMSEFGAAVVISKELSSLNDCCFLVAFDSIETDELSKKSPIILQNVSTEESNESILIGMNEVELPEFLAEDCPEDIDKIDFMSALYEINRCSNLRHTQAANLLFNGKIISKEEVSKMVREQFLQGSSNINTQ